MTGRGYSRCGEASHPKRAGERRASPGSLYLSGTTHAFDAMEENRRRDRAVDSAGVRRDAGGAGGAGLRSHLRLDRNRGFPARMRFVADPPRSRFARAGRGDYDSRDSGAVRRKRLVAGTAGHQRILAVSGEHSARAPATHRAGAAQIAGGKSGRRPAQRYEASATSFRMGGGSGGDGFHEHLSRRAAGTLPQRHSAAGPAGRAGENRRNSRTPQSRLVAMVHRPDCRDYAVDVSKPGVSTAESTRVLGKFLRDVVRRNPGNFRVVGPDETASNRLDALFEVTDKVFTGEILPSDDHLSPNGRVMEVLSEHMCQGWLEGYILTGRHGFFSCYEAFIHIVDSMFNQHAKWLKVSSHVPWRRPIASLNYLLTSHVWRQDHNGFSHQDPGFIDHVVNKKADVVRVYLPPDANTLLSVADHCLRSRQYVNVIVAGKQPALQWLTMDQAVKHCTEGLGIWAWASNDKGCEPDVVLACCGDVPTLETLAAVQLLRQHLPELKVRVINIENLMKLQPPEEHPHGLSNRDFDALFTKDKPIIFAFHGYPWLIHRLTYRRTNHKNLHVRGYKEEGTTTTPFDMAVRNDLDRFHLVEDVIDRLPQLGARAGYFKQAIHERLIEHKQYIAKHGDDMPTISGWKWGVKEAVAARGTTTEGDNV